MKRAVFLDKDGTLIENVPFNIDRRRIQLAPLAIDALRLLSENGFSLYVISNQPGLARGYFDENSLHSALRYIGLLIRPFGPEVSGYYFCPHDSDEGCDCRKPRPGLLIKAARENAIDLHSSWFIGDILDDVEAGHNAGCRSIMINNGNETEWNLIGHRMPDYLAPDLMTAAQEILRCSK